MFLTIVAVTVSVVVLLPFVLGCVASCYMTLGGSWYEYHRGVVSIIIRPRVLTLVFATIVDFLSTLDIIIVTVVLLCLYI